MATGAANSKVAANCNFVAKDQIWKDHVSLEENAAKNWPENWNFLTTKYSELVKDEFPPREKSNINLAMRNIPPVTPIEKYIHVDPSPQPVPCTTNRMIGWRSGEPNLLLDKYGRYARPRGGLLKQLNWPQEAIN